MIEEKREDHRGDKREGTSADRGSWSRAAGEPEFMTAQPLLTVNGDGQ